MSGQDNAAMQEPASEASTAPVLLGRSNISSTGTPGSGDEEKPPVAAPKKVEDPEEGLQRQGTLLERAGTTLQRAGSNLQLQRASTLPTEAKELRHAATMPMMHDLEASRPWCCGLWKTQQLVGFVLGVVLAILFVTVRPMRTYPVANEMLAITSVCASFWVFEVIPVYMTALFPLVLMPLMEVTSSEIAAQAYWNWISMLVVGTFLVDIALEEVHLPRRLALQLLMHVGVVSPGALLASFMAMCFFLAMVCNSIAVTLLITPFAIGLMNAAEEQVRNAAEAAEEEGMAAVATSGSNASQGTEAVAQAARDAKEVQKFADGLLLGIAFSSTSGGIGTITGAIANYFLAGESIVSAKVTWSSWFCFAFPISCATVLIAYVVLYCRYVRGLRFSGISRSVLDQEYEDLLSEVGPFSRDELLVGILQILQFVLLIIRPFAISPHFTTPYGSNLVNDATLACLPALLLFFIPSVVRPGQALLTWPSVHEKFDFGLLLLIGGSLAINSGFTQSGLNIALGDAFAKMIPHVHSFVLDLTIICCVTLAAQVLSGIGVAATMLPVLASASLQAFVNPLSLLLPATVATSFAFLLPTATPPNVVVLAKSQELPRALRFRDFFTNGLPLTIGAVFCGAILTHIMGRIVFDSQSPFPEWACEAAGAQCMWVAVPGDIEGVKVAAQACMVLLDSANGELCQLTNGTTVSTTEFLPAPV